MTTTEKSGCAAIFQNLFGSKPKPTPAVKVERLPYRLRDDFLSPAELNFYRVLGQAIGNSVVICTKVSLGDLFYATTGNRNENQTYRNKINRKHIDFLLCDTETMHPLVGIELDDASHQKTKRQKRDLFVEQVFSAAKLPLFRQRVQSGYNTRSLAAELNDLIGVNLQPTMGVNNSVNAPAQTVDENKKTKTFETTSSNASQANSTVSLCPKCEQPMTLRTVKKAGPHFGNQFWGCTNYPHCRGVREYK